MKGRDIKYSSKESQTIEFKPSWRDEYLKIICAFVNTEDGKLIIGVDVSEKTLYRDLQELVNRGLLKKIGKKKGTKYELL